MAKVGGKERWARVNVRVERPQRQLFPQPTSTYFPLRQLFRVKKIIYPLLFVQKISKKISTGFFA